MYNCNQCDKTFNSSKSLGGHMAMMIKRKKHIKEEKEKISKIKNEWLQENGKYKCPYCNKEYSKFGISTHIWRNHEDGKEFNPNLNTLNQQVWNKGLTKEKDKRLKKQGETFKRNLKLGLFIPNQKDKPHTQEVKNKISKSRIKYLNENPDKIPYLLNHSSKKSYPELTFEKYLNLYNIKGWFYNYSVNRFCLDFAFTEFKLDVEIDGGTHNLEKVKIKDNIRDIFLQEKGWKILRIKATDIKNNVYECINRVLKIIDKDKIIEIPKEFR